MHQPQRLTFLNAIKYLIDIIRWKYSPRQYIGRRVYIAGKMRTITGETYDSFFVKGMSHEISKRDRYILR